MRTFTLDEITRNAVLAALDERATRLEEEVALYQSEIALPRKIIDPERAAAAMEDMQRALVWNIAALHETKQAREIIGEASTPEQADDITAAKAYADWSESEKAQAFGR